MEYNIANVTLVTSRPLPNDVREYMAQWANDPIWEIWHAPTLFMDFEPELRAFAALYEAKASADWQERKAKASDLETARDAFVREDYVRAQACATLAQATAAQRQAAALERIADALYVEGINKEPRSVAAILSSMEWAQA